MSGRPTIKDVAAAAGVSVATASIALRDTGRLAMETRTRVKREAARLGYRANPHARSLRDGRSRVLALAMPGIRPMPTVVGSVEYYFRLLGAAAATALEYEHVLMVVPADPAAIAGLAIDGVVVIDPIEHDPLLDELRRRGIPTVTLGRPLGDRQGGGPVVDNDFVAGTREVLDHLHETGARRPALIACAPSDSFQQDSVAAYRAWCTERGVAPKIAMSASEAQDDADRTAEALLSSGTVPDAVYGTVDQLAESVIRAAARHGLAVPADLRVATCSETELTRRLQITTLDDRGDELGVAVVERLIGTITDPTSDPQPTIVPTDLIVRGSTVAGASAPDR